MAKKAYGNLGDGRSSLFWPKQDTKLVYGIPVVDTNKKIENLTISMLKKIDLKVEAKLALIEEWS